MNAARENPYPPTQHDGTRPVAHRRDKRPPTPPPVPPRPGITGPTTSRVVPGVHFGYWISLNKGFLRQGDWFAFTARGAKHKAARLVKQDNRRRQRFLAK